MTEPFIDVYLNQDFGTIVGLCNTNLASYRIVVGVNNFSSEQKARDFVKSTLKKLIQSE